MAKPVKKYNSGCISAAVWENEVNGDTITSVTLNKRYTDKDGEWKSTNSLNVTDMPKAIAVLQKAYEELTVKVSTE